MTFILALSNGSRLWYLVRNLSSFPTPEWDAQTHTTYIDIDIGLEVTDSLPVGTRIVAALFQGLAARASGFAIVSLSALAPAVQLGRFRLILGLAH